MGKNSEFLIENAFDTMDINDLKQMNDKHGHNTGDDVLKVFQEGLIQKYGIRIILADGVAAN